VKGKLGGGGEVGDAGSPLSVYKLRHGGVVDSPSSGELLALLLECLAR
jgi:hypothetical protein